MLIYRSDLIDSFLRAGGFVIQEIICCLVPVRMSMGFVSPVLALHVVSVMLISSKLIMVSGSRSGKQKISAIARGGSSLFLRFFKPAVLQMGSSASLKKHSRFTISPRQEISLTGCIGFTFRITGRLSVCGKALPFFHHDGASP